MKHFSKKPGSRLTLFYRYNFQNQSQIYIQKSTPCCGLFTMVGAY